MTLANFIFVLFIIISLLIFFVLVMLMRQIKKDAKLPAKKRTMLGAFLFIPAIFIFVFVFNQISDWRTNIQIQQKRGELNAFVNSVYEPLVNSQNAILREKKRMWVLLQKVEILGLEHPNHAQLITNITQKWRLGLEEYESAYNETDRKIREAWIAYNTMDQQDVLSKFGKQSVRLDLKNKKSQEKYQNTIYNIQDELIKSLDTARRLLDANRRPPKRKKHRRANKLVRENILPFSEGVELKLIEFLGRVDQRLRKEVETQQGLIRISSQRSIVVRNHLRNNPDLEAPLTTTINNWMVLEKTSREKLNQILYAVEAEYIALSLDLPVKSPAIYAMHKNLKKNIPLMVGKTLKQKKIIDQSYNIGARKKKK